MAITRTIELPIDIGIYQSESLPVANQLCKNLIPKQEQTEGTSTRGFLSNEFGIESHCVPIADGEFREFHLFADVAYAVVNSSLYSFDNAGTCTLIGTMTSTGTEDPIIADNGETMAILFPGNSLWFYDAANGLVQCTDAVVQSYEAEAGGIQSLAHVAGVFVYQTKSTLFSGSEVNVNRGQDFDALDFLEPFLNDSIRRVIEFRDELYVFGNDRCKPYGVAVTGAFPFAEIGGAAFAKGVANRYAIQLFDNSIVFAGGGKGESTSIWRVAGAGGVVKISTPYVDRRISLYDSGGGYVGLATSFTYNVAGHFCVGFTFGIPLEVLGADLSVGETFIYDATSSAMKGRAIWHERNSTTATRTTSHWKVRKVIDAYGNFYTGADDFGIGKISTGVYTEYGETITREFAGYYLKSENLPLFVDQLELQAETGVGNEWLSKTTPDRDPQIELFISDDGGRNFVSVGSRSLGKFQEYNTRLIWEQLGMCERTRLFKFVITAAVKVVLTNMFVRAEKGFW